MNALRTMKWLCDREWPTKAYDLGGIATWEDWWDAVLDAGPFKSIGLHEALMTDSAYRWYKRLPFFKRVLFRLSRPFIYKISVCDATFLFAKNGAIIIDRTRLNRLRESDHVILNQIYDEEAARRWESYLTDMHRSPQSS